MVKITGLTSMNVRALEETHQDAIASGNLVLGKTTATWAVPAEAALANLEGIMARLPVRGHPRHSLHAVARKLVRASNLQTSPPSALISVVTSTPPTRRCT